MARCRLWVEGECVVITRDDVRGELLRYFDNCGESAADFDVEGLTDEVYGLIGRDGAGRAGIDQVDPEVFAGLLPRYAVK